ncbi:hypothetical protein [Paenibacillus donghaensis]|uniref:Uncharacterized protein n=1 Tax=Paenibacillus donghaensis TaxID=414771 RepID=A0A2Z2KGD2_9BACL|nr:hypothetical protein [Paenibacillus donghaensis]ASA23075.1 hypothetical protein B9T62_21055 [Paenibacillus donghaensis]
MNDIFKRTSSSAVLLAGKPHQIKAVLAGWIEQYGRDMPLCYILLLQDQKRRTSSPQSKAG